MNRLGPLVYVRVLSMAKCGYKDYQGYISDVVDVGAEVVNVVNEDGSLLANGQKRCKNWIDFGWFYPGDPQWMAGLNPG